MVCGLRNGFLMLPSLVCLSWDLTRAKSTKITEICPSRLCGRGYFWLNSFDKPKKIPKSHSQMFCGVRYPISISCLRIFFTIFLIMLRSLQLLWVAGCLATRYSCIALLPDYTIHRKKVNIHMALIAVYCNEFSSQSNIQASATYWVNNILATFQIWILLQGENGANGTPGPVGPKVLLEIVPDHFRVMHLHFCRERLEPPAHKVFKARLVLASPVHRPVLIWLQVLLIHSFVYLLFLSILNTTRLW